MGSVVKTGGEKAYFKRKMCIKTIGNKQEYLIKICLSHCQVKVLFPVLKPAEKYMYKIVSPIGNLFVPVFGCCQTVASLLRQLWQVKERDWSISPKFFPLSSPSADESYVTWDVTGATI